MMPTETVQSKKNYIGIVSDRTDEQRAAELTTKPDRPMKDYLRDLVAAVLNRHGDAG